MKESAKSDCRFGILVKNYTRKVTSDVSDVLDVSDVTYVTDVTNRMLQDVTDVTDVTCETSEDTFPIQFFTRIPNLPLVLHDSFTLILYSHHTSLM